MDSHYLSKQGAIMKKLIVLFSLSILSTSTLAGVYQCNDSAVHFLDMQTQGINCDTLKCLDEASSAESLVKQNEILALSCHQSESGNSLVPTVEYSDLKTKSKKYKISGELVCTQDALHFLDDGNCSTANCVKLFHESLANSSLNGAKVKELDAKCVKSPSGNYNIPTVKYTLQVKN